MKLYVYVPSYVECFILYTFKYFLSEIILQLHFVKKSLYTMANMLVEVKHFFTWQNIQMSLLYIKTLNAACTVLSANICHSITLLGSQVV